MSKRFRILAVDDDPINLQLITAALKKDYDVLTAKSGQAALELLREQEPDLILLDVMMPTLNGFEVCAIIKEDERFATTPIIFLTALDTREGAMRGLELGGIDYLTKPVEFDLLKLRVRNHLALKERNEQLQEQRNLLARQKEEYQTLFNEMLDGFALHEMIWDEGGNPADYRFLAVNPAFERLTGLKAEEIRGRTVLDLMPETEAHWIETYGKVTQSGVPVFFENYSTAMNNHFEVKAFRSAPNQFACVFADTTERRRAEAERYKLEQQFQHTQKLESLGVLASGIAHDFNNILAVIMGSCFLAQKDVETAGDHLARIEVAAVRGADLCRQMLTYADQSRTTLDPVHIGQMIEEMTTLLQASMRENVTIKVESAPTIPCVIGDSSQLSQVVMNLIINAAEAIDTATGEIRIRLETINIDASSIEKDHLGQQIPPGLYVCLEVADTGCGMSEEVKRRLFEPFYTTKFTGRGLGLSATLGIIKGHQGALQLFSQPGQGTSFKVYLPVSRNAAVKGDLPQPSQTTPWRGSGTVLLVDDEDAIRLAVSAMLQILGFTVLNAADGQEALALYQNHATEIDFVLSDMGMPVMTGYELFKELKELNSDLPIIASSGFGDAEISHGIAGGEVAGILNKPYNFEQLREVVKQVVETAQSKG